MNELIFVLPYVFSTYPMLLDSLVEFVHDVTSEFLENE